MTELSGAQRQTWVLRLDHLNGPGPGNDRSHTERGARPATEGLGRSQQLGGREPGRHLALHRSPDGCGSRPLGPERPDRWCGARLPAALGRRADLERPEGNGDQRRSQRRHEKVEAAIKADALWRAEVKREHPVLGRVALALTPRPTEGPEPQSKKRLPRRPAQCSDLRFCRGSCPSGTASCTPIQRIVSQEVSQPRAVRSSGDSGSRLGREGCLGGEQRLPERRYRRRREHPA